MRVVSVLRLMSATVSKLGAALRPRESYHLARKTFHFSTIMAFAVLYSAKLPRWQFVKGMAGLDTCVVVGELARLRVEAINRALLRRVVLFWIYDLVPSHERGRDATSYA